MNNRTTISAAVAAMSIAATLSGCTGGDDATEQTTVEASYASGVNYNYSFDASGKADYQVSLIAYNDTDETIAASDLEPITLYLLLDAKVDGSEAYTDPDDGATYYAVPVLDSDWGDLRGGAWYSVEGLVSFADYGTTEDHYIDFRIAATADGAAGIATFDGFGGEPWPVDYPYNVIDFYSNVPPESFGEDATGDWEYVVDIPDQNTVEVSFPVADISGANEEGSFVIYVILTAEVDGSTPLYDDGTLVGYMYPVTEPLNSMLLEAYAADADQGGTTISTTIGDGSDDISLADMVVGEALWGNDVTELIDFGDEGADAQLDEGFMSYGTGGLTPIGD
ncbi:hypothetical protein [Demequina sp. NBRC 110054]|uniref:hypothetical protein n=1 Tax=Demequina sp. NBRC 110054 TaxID=1570343 RepID=UPI0013564493|nr:hypothetical protein [Demequina sp. NBRC 110054]